MKRIIGTIIAAAAALVIQSVSAEQVQAQASSGGCTLEQIGGTARHLVRCRGGLSITTEQGAQYTLLDRTATGSVDAVRLTGKALLIDLPENVPSSGLEVVTPQAIAAVRGTQWAVDVEQDATSVFVVRGAVAVSRRAGGAGVVLGPGEGVDVDESGAALEVRRWPAARVNALMARFGR
ncbi:FecR domain-containing protein [Mesorhizobium xinjiangense]|uniref:FecR domain-containing protein n=1 Tax=Mesorhizobium xinjiangense TaxID=2678685 RepID=UPI0012ED80F3|nr:FecR domain-containing protein [Mesorhizobium xinjiangense]